MTELRRNRFPGDRVGAVHGKNVRLLVGLVVPVFLSGVSLILLEFPAKVFNAPARSVRKLPFRVFGVRFNDSRNRHGRENITIPVCVNAQLVLS